MVYGPVCAFDERSSYAANENGEVSVQPTKGTIGSLEVWFLLFDLLVSKFCMSPALATTTIACDDHCLPS